MKARKVIWGYFQGLFCSFLPASSILPFPPQAGSGFRTKSKEVLSDGPCVNTLQQMAFRGKIKIAE
jgi:hypothetical protein